jgi:hypothetical protein
MRCQQIDGVRKLINAFQPDLSRQAMLGISMGAKQALAIVLSEQGYGGISMLGLLNGNRMDIGGYSLRCEHD